MWMVRAGRGGDNVEDFVKHGLVALGGSRLGKVDPSIRKEDLLALFAAKYPEEKDGSRAVWASQVANRTIARDRALFAGRERTELGPPGARFPGRGPCKMPAPGLGCGAPARGKQTGQRDRRRPYA
jgi:hypothetical protein